MNNLWIYDDFSLRHGGLKHLVHGGRVRSHAAKQTDRRAAFESFITVPMR